ncbi:MAG: hypothetical protein JJE25_14990 [Bacteroidia bacterium]|nr:hypothetical protein [Bacteroidia bacterium]
MKSIDDRSRFVNSNTVENFSACNVNDVTYFQNCVRATHPEMPTFTCS